MDETLAPEPPTEESPSENKDAFSVSYKNNEATIAFPVGSDVSSATELMGIIHDQIKNPDINLIRFDLSEAHSIDRPIFGQITQAWLKAKHQRERGLDKNIVLRGVEAPQIRELFEEKDLLKVFEVEETPKE